MNIAIITGGVSGEREVSINSAKNIKEILNLCDSAMYIFPEDQDRFNNSDNKTELVIPIIHGVGGEDGELQTYLDSKNIPYLFSNPAVHKTALNKRQAKQIAKELGINTAQEIVAQKPHFPLFAKPNFGGSSIATKLCTNRLELEHLQQENPLEDFLLEEPINGKEFTVGVVEYNNATHSLPVVEIITNDGFFDYKSKYDSENLAHEVCPAIIDSNLEKNLKNAAVAVHNKIGARHISRSDFIVSSDGKIIFLEINTIPGLTKTSLIPKMLLAESIDIRDLFLSWCNESAGEFQLKQTT